MDRGAWQAAVHGVSKSQTDHTWSLLFSMVTKIRNNFTNNTVSTCFLLTDKQAQKVKFPNPGLSDCQPYKSFPLLWTKLLPS